MPKLAQPRTATVRGWTASLARQSIETPTAGCTHGAYKCQEASGRSDGDEPAAIIDCGKGEGSSPKEDPSTELQADHTTRRRDPICIQQWCNKGGCAGGGVYLIKPRHTRGAVCTQSAH